MMESVGNNSNDHKKDDDDTTEQRQHLLSVGGGNDDDYSESMNNEEAGDLVLLSTDGDSSTKKRPKRPKKNKSITETVGVFGDTPKQRLKKRSEKQTDKLIKYGALFLLVAQMVGLVLLMRYSRTVPRSPDVPLYLASTAVYIMEVIKLIICLLVILIQTQQNFLQEMKYHIFESPMEIVKLCVPSLTYTIQNNLLYLALTNLDAATYQVCYQLKILTTALFSAILLQRKFSSTKWISLIVLTIGVAVVEISGSGDQHTAKHNQTSGSAESLSSIDEDTKNRWIGLLAVVCAACTSGFSGVYFEKILKGSNTSLWIRNVQMGLPSVIIAYITVYTKDAADVQKHGFFGGYTAIVWTVVIVQAVGGLIVATVVKYADNVLKVFATSFSIVISCIISAFLFDFHPTFLFMVGASLVVTATVMYSSPEKKVKRKTILPLTNKPRK